MSGNQELIILTSAEWAASARCGVDHREEYQCSLRVNPQCVHADESNVHRFWSVSLQ